LSTVIKVEDLSKQYRLGTIGTGTLSHDINRWWHSVRGKEDPYLKIGQANDRTQKEGTEDYVWALKDINFEVKAGEVLGVIGKNGAGKSTLLKILSRTTLPTTGSVKVKGRIASLLEVGTGFHPELTGRENIFLNGAILGMRKAEIKDKFDEILDFAGVGKYIDTPVKRYSSGMYVRLAFAVAAHLDPDILIVDEVLAVGDAEFQKKCLGKMKDVSEKDGRTVLFVSHDMQAVHKLTQNSLLLKAGLIDKYGSTDEVINNYMENYNSGVLTYECEPLIEKPKITCIKLATSLPNNVHICGDDLEFNITVSVPKNIRSAWFVMQISDLKDRNFIHVWLNNSEKSIFDLPGTYQIKCTLPKCRLFMGKYICNFFVSEPPGGETYEVLKNVCPFEIVMFNHPREFVWRKDECVYLEDNIWDIKKIK
jgi:lipopolysaccharide transport system ATP-binding protein